MPELTPELEDTIRQKLADKAFQVSQIGVAIASPEKFTGKEDFAGFIGLINAVDDTPEQRSSKMDSHLTKYVIIYWSGYKDAEVMGTTQQCPPTQLTYIFKVFQENDVQNNSVNSHNDFVRTVILLRNKFLKSRRFFEIDGVVHKSLIQIESVQTDVESEYVPGSRGHAVTLQLIVEVN